MIKTLIIIGSGGFLGSIGRFLLSRFVQINWPYYFPWGTLMVNVSGCLLIGILFGLSERSVALSGDWKAFLAIGFCGGFTTFSTFSQESLTLFRDSAYLLFFSYIGLSVVLCLSATLLGMLLIKII
ncbi:MAG: fluoride efflux transporter CrcB [Lentimicrobiaceae bacterium]|nr:fluoride efflux transporter CrcB [Lentimicrobiaceae bacterium]